MATRRLIKKPAYHPTPRNDIYVQRKTPLSAYLRRAEKMLESRETLIMLHGLGAAIEKTIRLANTLQRKYPCMGLQIDTATQNVVDSLDGDNQVNRRSAVHIRLSQNMYE